MEIIELIFLLGQGCECFLVVMGMLTSAGGAVETVRGRNNREERRAAKKAGQKPPPLSLDNWIAIILFAITAFVIFVLIVALTMRP